MAWNDGLTGKALAIAASKSKIIKVEAGPGTGKSFVMKRRVARLLESGISPRKILAVTFTRTAASALIKDLHNLDVKGCEDIRVGTLHSFCYSLLMKNAVFEYLGRVPKPLITFNKFGILQFQGYPLLQDINKPSKFGTKRDKAKRIKAFEADWARLQSEKPGWPKTALDREFEKELTKWLKFHRAILIGEVIPLALRYLKNNPTATELNQFNHIIVDEYQDLNKAEQELIDVLGKNSSIAVVGDPDQSIYKFRYAHPEGLSDFVTNHAGVDEKGLDKCRRCPTKVVDLANELILNNHPTGVVGRLQPTDGNPEGKVHIVQWNDLDEQTKGITKYIKHLIDSERYQAKDFLVLCPRRQIGYAIRDLLLKKNIPSHSFFNEESLEEEEAQRAFTLLCLVVDDEDRVALRFWLGLGSNSWLENEYRRLREYCEQNDSEPLQVLNQIVDGTIELTKVSNLVNRFRSLIEKLEVLKDLKGQELVDSLFPEKKDWALLLREASMIDLNDDTTSKHLLERLRSIITQPEIPDSPDYVRVMSLYKSKGLTSRVTIVVGVIQGLVPLLLEDGTHHEKEESLKEQRRVLYVAITRSTDILVISSIRILQRDLAHKMRVKLPYGVGAYGTVINSQFIGELGPHAPTVQAGLRWQKDGYE
ncbi:MAG: ATP-dependent helicase [Bacteroidetes bacterium]|nr:ATP-dependent helicase [Bacteroidota bacterium]MBU1421675.1 ATP-dependent helicase [Bacteroidota bacterium]MBU2636834.1 ATP-dependent helicase [Bacteroidota bacterium]